MSELRKRKLLDKAYVYGFDETLCAYDEGIKALFGEIKRRYPDLPIASTCHNLNASNPKDKSIDRYVVLSWLYNGRQNREFRATGGEPWWYVCCFPQYPFANWLLEDPLVDARLSGGSRGNMGCKDFSIGD